MKQILLVMLIIVLFTGCVTEHPEHTTPPTTALPTENHPAETAPSLLDPENSVTRLTHGAISALTLGDGEWKFALLGDKPLLISTINDTVTRLVILDKNSYSPLCTADFEHEILPGDLGFRVTANYLGYYVQSERAVIVLDSKLREVSRTVMPDDIEGLPLICEDMRTVYYSSGAELRVLDLETGISRVLRQRDCRAIILRKSLLDDSLLVCGIEFDDGTVSTEFISSEDGSTIGKDDQCINIESYGERFYLERFDGIILERIVGKRGDKELLLDPHEATVEMISALAMDALIGVSWDLGTGTRLRLYDLNTGTVISSVRAVGLEDLRYITVASNSRSVWFVAADESGKSALYKWDTDVTRKENSSVHLAQRFTAENPDAAGLAACRAEADKLEKEFEIRLHLDQSLPVSEGYAFILEHNPAAYSLAIDQLEEILGQFPEGFFAALGDASEDGFIHIGLVREQVRKAENVAPDASGYQYWVDGNAYLTLEITNDISGAFYHQLAHVLDTFIMNRALQFDDWEDLNPPNFQYDGNYTDYLSREEEAWLAEDTRAFVDGFGMTFPREDRAQIFAAAMDSGANELFASEILQVKLEMICKGIRDAFELRKASEAFLWEQHLLVPLK